MDPQKCPQSHLVLLYNPGLMQISTKALRVGHFFLPCFCSTHWSPLKSARCSHTNLLHHRTSRRMPIHTTQPFFSLWDPIALPKLYRRIRAQPPSDFLAHKPILGQPSPHTPAQRRSEFCTSEIWFQGPSIPWE